MNIETLIRDVLVSYFGKSSSAIDTYSYKLAPNLESYVGKTDPTSLSYVKDISIATASRMSLQEIYQQKENVADLIVKTISSINPIAGIAAGVVEEIVAPKID